MKSDKSGIMGNIKDFKDEGGNLDLESQILYQEQNQNIIIPFYIYFSNKYKINYYKNSKNFPNLDILN